MLYKKTKLSRDHRDTFFRCIGVKVVDGKRKQARFYLGFDEAKATLANLRLESLWRRIEQTQDEPAWDEVTNEIGKAIARGEVQYVMPPDPRLPDPDCYVHWVARYAKVYGDIIPIVPEREDVYAAGLRDIEEQREEAIRRRIDPGFPSASAFPAAALPTDRPHETLHQALDEFIRQVEARGNREGWGGLQVRQAKTLRNNHADIPLSQMTLAVMEEMAHHWASRPKVKGRDKVAAPTTARRQFERLKAFWKWLDRNPSYTWKRPDGWEDIRLKVQLSNEEKAAKVKTLHIRTYTVEELTALYTHASPLTRLLLLLGLNCGFQAADMGQLMADEVFFDQAHPHSQELRYKGGNSDCWIKRIRIKTGVYGEFKLWGHTVQGLRWAIRRKREIGSKVVPLLVTERGTPLTAPTKTKNKSSRIPNIWSHLHKTLVEAEIELPKLPFKFIRKTAGELVRRASSGEISGVFFCHGTPVKTDNLLDVYTNRPFGKVFRVLDKVEQELQPMFGAVLNPFPE